MSPLIRPFRRDDLPSALALCRSAGWNQTRQDWLRMIEYEPNGCFVAENDGEVIATVTTTTYGSELAWIGMMLVHPELRRKGIATKLMNASLAFLRSQGVRCIKLDATPAGQPVYARLGFQAEWSYHRWQRVHSDRRKADPLQGTLSKIAISCDRIAFGADRSRFLKRLGEGSRVVDHGQGYGMMRPGHLASYLGPIVANDRAAAGEIAEALLDQASETVFWDVPHPNQDAVELARRLDFKPVRDLTRMWTGSHCVEGNIQLQYALSDPGTG